VDFVIARATSLGLARLNLDLIAANARLRRWYEGMGFVFTGKRTVEGIPFEIGSMTLNLPRLTGAKIILRRPSAADFRRLRKAAGWPVPDQPVCKEAIRNSLFGVVAVADGQVVGMARVVGDGTLNNYIQDLIVQPEYQRQGIGRRLMEAVMGELARRAAPGSDVALISAPQAIRFYESFSFARCTPDKPGMRRRL
jgi:ribosomal protein S18 acetylase RimI-like enzyme